MKREGLLYKIMSAVHIIFFSSIFFFLTILLSGTLLLLPALTSIFLMGKKLIYKKIDVNDSTIKIYFSYLMSSMKLMKFVILNIIFLLNLLGCIVSLNMGIKLYSIVCIVIMSVAITIMFFVAGYHTFVKKEFQLTEVIIWMFMKPSIITMILIPMMLLVIFFNINMIAIAVFCGTFFIFVLEGAIYLHYITVSKLLESKNIKAQL